MIRKLLVVFFVLGIIPISNTSGDEEPIIPKSINLSMEPSLSSDGEEFLVKVGMKINIRAEVTFSDGSKRDVTDDPLTLFLSLDNKIATVSKSGEVKFLDFTKTNRFVGSVGIVVGFMLETPHEIAEMLDFKVAEPSGKKD